MSLGVNCDKMKESSVQIFIPHERTFILVFRQEEWLVGDDQLYLKFWVKLTPFEHKRDYLPVVEDRPILSAEYRLPLLIKLTHPAIAKLLVLNKNIAYDPKTCLSDFAAILYVEVYIIILLYYYIIILLLVLVH